MSGGAETRRYRATIAYDGTRFHGFQRQANASPTVQSTLEDALAVVTRQKLTIVGAGRTDAGVHATGQVIACDVSWRHSPADLRNALNATLPADVAVWHLDEAQPDFHPRYDALSRTYVYRLWQAAQRDPLQRLSTWYVRQPLDVAAISAALQHLPGQHDFATFGSPPQGENTRRTVFRAEWQAQADPARQGTTHTFTIEANAFLYRMVRSLVGTLHKVGIGQLSPGKFRETLAAAERSRSGPAAPPYGLTLVAVKYDE